MTLNELFRSLGLVKPLISVRGDIFDTPAWHIAFGVAYPDKNGHYDNSEGFASLVAEYGWADLGSICFKKGEPQTRQIGGKYFHALPVHFAGEGGWEETPDLIQECLNKLPVKGHEVIAIVLIGGGDAGKQYGANINNIGGMLRSYKTVVLYVYDGKIYDLLVGLGIVAEPIPERVALQNLPKVVRLRDGNTVLALGE